MWIAAIVFLVLVIPMVISHHLESYRRYRNYSDDIVNHDASLREFVYKVDKSRDEIWDSLKRNNTTVTSLKYRFNENDGTIVFYSDLPDTYLDITYGISFFERQEYTILKVVQRNHFWERNKYALLQNEFWYQMLGATPIPYTRQPK